MKIFDEIFFISSLKTSLLKWKPDFDSAADEYNKAGKLNNSHTILPTDYYLYSQLPAMCYRNAKQFNECRDCLLKCSDCNRQNRQIFHAAKALDQAILICKDLNDYNSIRNYAERACHMYQVFD
jgi:tetratricopeptide (TPR) repeat protein